MAELELLQMLIDGQWCSASDGTTFECIDPSTGIPWALIPEASHADVNRAVEAAAVGFGGSLGGDDPHTARQAFGPACRSFGRPF